MIVRNWMQKNPITVTGDTPVVEAQHLVSEHDLRILPVMEGGRLRGVLTRKNLNEAANCVARTQNIHEVNYFVNRLKVKDLMNRMVKTVDINDTVEYCMLKGRRESVSTFPVLENGVLVGLVSEVEIFESLLHILGAEERWEGITLEPMEVKHGTLGRIAQTAEAAGATIHGLLTMRLKDSTLKKVILRFETADLDQVVKSLETAGYKVFEVISDVQACRLEAGNHGVKCPAP
ncbi:MAG: CBS domain-containing protein [Thermodesulfobacteriota bacterium]